MGIDNRTSPHALGNFFNARLSWCQDEKQFSRSVLVVETSGSNMNIYIPKGSDRPRDAVLYYPRRSQLLYQLERTEDEGVLTQYRIIGSIDEQGKSLNLSNRANGQWEKNEVSDGANDFKSNEL